VNSKNYELKIADIELYTCHDGGAYICLTGKHRNEISNVLNVLQIVVRNTYVVVEFCDPGYSSMLLTFESAACESKNV